jgi:lipid II:glycine glycyltransferase (peptidoglycan interpeptide bridge formation enzyme)
MNNKQKYKEFAEKERLPIFMQPFWLDSVCEEGMKWDVILYEKGGEIWGSFVYVIQKKYGFTLIKLPKLTQFLGPYIKYPEGQKYYTKLSWEKEVMNYFIDSLPKFDYFNMNFHHSITNWLPFYWREFKQTTRYTYVIDKNIKIEELSQNFETDIRRRRRRKAEKLGIKTNESNEIEKFYKLNSLTFNRQGINIPYNLDFVNKIYYSLEKENAVKILIAKFQNEEIASAFLIEDKNTVYYLMGGIEPSKKDLGAMDLILYESIKYALSKNKNFDFEGSIIETIEKYFRSFGAIQKPYFNVYKINSKLLKIIQCLRELLK